MKRVSRDKHRMRHVELHRALDELLADFARTRKGTILDRQISELLAWSYQETKSPTEHHP